MGGGRDGVSFAEERDLVAIFVYACIVHCGLQVAVIDASCGYGSGDEGLLCV